MADLTLGQLKVVLEADASRYAAVMKSATADSKKLADALRKDLEPSQRAINAAAKDFLGGNEIRKAREYASAIEKIGGVSKLTAADQKKVNAAVSEALKHYRALGIEAPKNLIAIKNATQGAAVSMAGIGTAARSMLATMGVTFSVGAVVGFTKNVLDTAEAIDDMSEKMQVSAEFAQRLKFGLEKTGATIETGERALFEMSKTLSEAAQNGKKLEELNKILSGTGLTMEQLFGMNREQQMRAVMTAAGAASSELQRTAIMTEFWGKSAIEITPLVVKGFDNVTASVKVMSDDTVKRLADAKQHWEEFFNSITMHSGEMIGNAMRDLDLFATHIGTFWEALKRSGVNPIALRRELELQRENLLATGPRSSNFGKDVNLAAPSKPAATRFGTTTPKPASAFFGSEKLAQELKKITEELKRVGGQANLTSRDLFDLAENLDEIQRKGGVLTPELESIRSKFMFFRDMVKDTRIELALLEQGRGSLAFMQFLGRGAGAQASDLESRRDFFQSMKPLDIPFQGLHADNLKQLKRDTGDWRKELDRVVDAFEDLANIAGPTMSDVSRGIGAGTQSALMFDDGIRQIGKASTWQGVLGGISSLIGGLSQAVELGRMLGDALTRNEAEKAAADIRRTFGKVDADLRNIGEDSPVAQRIEQLVKDLKIARDIASDLVLSDIIDAAGGIDAGNFEAFRNRAFELFVDIEQGGEVGTLAMKELDTVIGQLGKHVTEVGGIWDEEFVKMLRQAQAEGMELASVMELVKGQLDIAASGLNKVLGGGASDQGEFDRQSRLALATFNAQVGNGIGSADAIASIKPAIDSLKESASQFGFAANDAFNQLVRWSELVSANQPLLDQVAGLNEMMVALANVGGLTAETFADIQAQGVDTFKSLTDAGFTQHEALAQMKPMLETIIKLHEERGLVIDDETQALINQGRESGIIADRQVDAQEAILDVLIAIGDVLGATIPEGFRKAERAAEQAADGIEDAFNSIEIDDITVGVDVDSRELHGLDVPGAAKGAFVPKRPGGTLVRVGEGDSDEWILPDPDFRSLVAAWADGPALPSMSTSSLLGSSTPTALAGGSGLGAQAIYVDNRVLGEVTAEAQIRAASRAGLGRV